MIENSTVSDAVSAHSRWDESHFFLHELSFSLSLFAVVEKREMWCFVLGARAVCFCLIKCKNQLAESSIYTWASKHYTGMKIIP